MSATPALPEPADLARQRDEDAQYYREVLHKLIAMGTDLAAAVHRQALADPAASQPTTEDQPASPSPSPSQATSFDRLARTVRRTIALARTLAEPAREAPGPKLRPNECPHERRPDCAETDARDAEPWAEPCERPEAAECDADEDFDADLDDQSFADLIASIGHNTALAHLTDAELLAHRTPPSETCCACPHREAIPRREHPRSGCKAAGLTSPPPRITQPTPDTPRPGTGPPTP